jgi:hypothetical protein
MRTTIENRIWNYDEATSTATAQNLERGRTDPQIDDVLCEIEHIFGFLSAVHSFQNL